MARIKAKAIDSKQKDSLDMKKDLKVLDAKT